MSFRDAGDGMVHAPFTPAQVEALTQFQTGGWFHPFTCGRRSEHPGVWPFRDEGILIATVDGWHCPVPECAYVQRWAHDFMADAEWVRQMDESHRRFLARLVEPDSDSTTASE